VSIGRADIVPALRARLAHAAWRLGDRASAAADDAAAVAAIEAGREPLRDESLLIGLMGRWQGVYEEATLRCVERGDARAAFDYSERARARAFADLLARRGGPPDQQAEPIDSRAAQAALPPGALLLSYVATGLRGPEGALLDAMPPEAAAVRACLEVPPRLVLFALTRDDLRAFVCPIDPNLLNAGSAFLADGQRFLRPAILRRLDEALLAPAAGLLAAADHLIVVPHGPLHQLPFAALTDGAGAPLIDRVARLSYGPSATVLLSDPPPPARAAGACLAIGYDGGAGSALRHTEDEAAAVAAICGGVALRGGPGVLGRLRDMAGRHLLLHLACHGEFRLDEPLESWLELGPGERLRAADVIGGLSLDADLVTLSACRSGVSRVARGDEPFGLVRAFLAAGARAVLVTLWPVEDRSARLLMERFYAELLAPGADAAAALRAAQLALRGLAGEGGARPYADPLFWAGYALIGRAGAAHLEGRARVPQEK
jgi:hypothetical protein